MKSIAICWIGIGDYNILFNEMYKSFNEKFCNDLNKTFFIFTDKPELYKDINNAIVYTISNACTHKGFVLFRKWKYLLMAEDKYLNYDYVAYLNGNLVCKEIVDSKDIINEDKQLTIITHPTQSNSIKKNIYNCDSRCNASFKSDINDWFYSQACFFVVESKEFLKMANTIEGWRHLDKASGADKYVPWHDETYFNKYCYLNKNKLNILDGRIYSFPTDVSWLQQYYDNCKIYTRGKKKLFESNNLKFIPSISPDLYTLN